MKHLITAPRHVGFTEIAQENDGSHRLKHSAMGAGIGAAAGLIVGTVAGLMQDSHNRDGIIPATPVIAVEGLGIGLVAGMVIGALVK